MKARSAYSVVCENTASGSWRESHLRYGRPKSREVGETRNSDTRRTRQRVGGTMTRLFPFCYSGSALAGVDRQREGKRAAAPRFALEPDATAVGFDDTARYRESQARSTT